MNLQQLQGWADRGRNAQQAVDDILADLEPSPGPISLQVELPEDLHAVLQEYLSAHPGRDLNNVAQVAIALFLQQNGPSSRAVSGLYLDGLFGKVADE